MPVLVFYAVMTCGPCMTLPLKLKQVTAQAVVLCVVDCQSTVQAACAMQKDSDTLHAITNLCKRVYVMYIDT
jgi:hypothetical protein